MRILKRSLIITLGILLFSSSVVAQEDSWGLSSSEQGYYDEEQPSVSEESAAPEEPVEYPRYDNDKPSTFGILLGYALDFETLPYHPYGFAVGVRGGYTLDVGVYLGVKLIYYGGGMENTVHQNAITADVEIGYDIDADVIVVRPSIDLGLEARKEFFHFAPGASIIVPFKDSYFVGFDTRYLLVFDSDPIQGISFIGSLGVRY